MKCGDKKDGRIAISKPKNQRLNPLIINDSVFY